MASFFEEAGVFDRPFVDVTLKVGGKDVALKARIPSSQDQDALEAYFAAEHAHVLAEMSQPKNGNPCELDTLRSVFGSRPNSDLIHQLLGTRRSDILTRAVELSGLDMSAEIVKMNAMTDEEREAHSAENEKKIAEAEVQARAEFTAEYEASTREELVEQASQVAMNIKALARVNRALGPQFIYFSLYRPDETKRAFDSPDQVKEQLSPATIETAVNAIRAALDKDASLPPSSPEGDAPSGRSSSPKDSAVDTTTSGEPTGTTTAA